MWAILFHQKLLKVPILRDWGEGTVDELANFIALKMPSLTGFNRRGLYRMKQFYETYSKDSDCYKLWNGIHEAKEQSLNVSPVATQMTPEKADNLNVLPAATHLDCIDKQFNKFISLLLIQISWTNHLEILSGATSSEEKLYYQI